ncbi:hypothetical protein PCASD_01867 [Puccinia coronata f. sp. avenae]|uniref:Alpha/beta hydrolase fold-3 domain-containing protein n=1 Tax=Puccinia coronata f. sp. avenae TaxID=200324 RepID=A0A2N5VJJ1_9BASI|nr:hypothetical protein PCASD_01867 [Puccinia coronata f. sp. avenae]
MSSGDSHVMILLGKLSAGTLHGRSSSTQDQTPSVSSPTSVSVTTSIPSKNHTGTRLPTSLSSLKSLLEPFNSTPQEQQLNNQQKTTTTTTTTNEQPTPSPLNNQNHSHSTQPPTSDEITTEAHQTGGPDAKLTQANPHPARYSPAARLPGTNRIGIDLGQRPASPQIGVRNAWQYLPFLTKQATNIASSFLSHHLNGPPKKSWGIEMTIFTAIVREMANYTHLSSIHQLRTIMDFGQILPTPKDGIITPVSFKVKPNHLTGFLKELDQAETGNRILTGEWVLSKKTWKRMQTESLARRAHNPDFNNNGDEFAHSVKMSPSPSHQHGLGQDKVIYYIHGGAYFIMSASTHRPLTISIAKYTECRLFAINYRLAPETKFPGPLHDTVAGYFRLLNDLCIPAQNIVVSGDSAGGGLVMALLMYLRDEGYPLPSAAMVFSPWCDLTMSCDSWETNQPYDFLPMPKPDDPLNPVKCYLGDDGIKKWITHPYASPLFGDMHGLPPLLIQAGDAEVLRDEITLLAHKASLHGVKVMHEIYEDCVHVFQAFLFLESSTKALQSMRNYIRHVLPKMERQSSSDQSLNPSPPAAAAAEDTYRPPTRAPSDDDQSIYAIGDPNQGAVDREISRDAHLVDDMSQPIKETLPPTPAVPNLLGSADDEVSDGEEVLSGDDDSDGEDEVLDASATPVSPSAVPEQHQPTDSPASRVDSRPDSLSLDIGRSASSVSLSRLSENRKSGLSLRGRLPPAMDIETIQNLIMQTPLQEVPPPEAGGAGESSGYRSPTSLKEDLRRLSVGTSACSSPRRTSLQPAPMLPIHSNASSRVSIHSPSEQASPPGSQHHQPARTPGGHQSVGRPTHSRKYTASNVALLTPMVRTHHDPSGSGTVNADLQAIFHQLITTPSELRTTVYTQGDDEDDEQEKASEANGEYFRPANNPGPSHHHYHRHQRLPSSTNTLTPGHHASSSSVSPSRHSSRASPVDDPNTLIDQNQLVEDPPPPSPEFAFQTPGYGFS